MIRSRVSTILIAAWSLLATFTYAQRPDSVMPVQVSGTLTVRLTGWDQAGPIQVSVTTPQSSGGGTLRVGDNPVLVFRGKPFGAYEVSASQEPNRATRGPVRVTLSADHPDPVVELELRDSRSRLQLTDERGVAVTDPIFRGRVFPRPRSIGAGIYSLEGEAPGGALRIIRGSRLAPVCRRVPFDSILDVGFRIGRRVEIQWTPARDASIAGWEFDAEGSDCPVLLSDFASARPGVPGRVVLENFPEGRVVMRLGYREYEIPADVDGPVVITR